MDLVLNATGLQPFLFVLGFTLALAFITTGFRDKPWLLVLGTLTASGGLLFIVLYILKQLDISNAWDVLLTGSGYFTKTKIFGTVAEANAPNRAQLFASFGPITFVLALVMGILLLVDGIRHRKQTHLVFGVWVFAASFMAWNAARFMFNAAPIMAVLGAAGVVALWGNADWNGLKLKWQKFGIRTPADRIAGARKAVWKTPSFSAIMIVMLLIFSQQATYGLDSAIPGSSTSERELDEDVYNIMPDIFRFEILGFSLLDSSLYTGNWYLGSFGSSFNDNGWNLAYQWLAEQDTEAAYSERPAFVSWWDYGFQALNTGQHPSVSDNFQSGIPATGNMLLARNQDDLTAMFIWQLAEGDRTYMESTQGSLKLSQGFVNNVDRYLTDEQLDEFVTLQTQFDEEMVDYTTKRAFTVMKTNRDVVMAQGYAHDAGVFNSDQELFRIWKDGERLLCEDTSGTECSNGDWLDQGQANITFTNNIRSGQDTVM
jgi:dolichyl-diphosphooligosaccharide--protein glycosyltransferase